MSPKKNRPRVFGTKFLGRVLRKWRLVAGCSQEELARCSEVSLTVLGAVERETGFISDEILVDLCLGLELQLGQPMLEQVFIDTCHLTWQHMVTLEASKRQGLNLEPVAYKARELGLEDIDSIFDGAYEGVKRFTHEILRALGVRGNEDGRFVLSKSPSGDLLPPVENARGRVRRTGRAPTLSDPKQE